MSGGVGTASTLLSLTLGPSRGRILVDNRKAGEPLDDGDILMERLLELPDAFEDMGHQILRKALSSVGRKCHDGTATCAVIAQSILRDAEPLLTSGHDARQLSQDIAVSCRHAIDWIDQQAWPAETVRDVERVLETAMVEADLAASVAEIIGTVGASGSVTVEEWRLPDLAYEYVQGSRWTTRLASPYFLRSNTTVMSLADPLVGISAAPMDSVEAVAPAIEAAASSPGKTLALIAPSFSDRVISVLLANRDAGILQDVIAITAPKSIHFGKDILDDIAAIVGAPSPHMHQGTRRLSPSDLGTAAEVWASMSAFGIAGGNGDPQSLEARHRTVQRMATTEGNQARRRQLNDRAGTLAGMSALIRVPSRTAAFGVDQSRKVEKALAIARQAIRDGVLPGGGAALARCAFEIEATGIPEPGTRILCGALRAPMTALLTNAGISPSVVLHDLARSNGNDVFDASSKTWQPAHEAGPIDALVTTRTALQTAVSVALMVISTDTLVSRGAVGANVGQRQGAQPPRIK